MYRLAADESLQHGILLDGRLLAVPSPSLLELDRRNAATELHQLRARRALGGHRTHLQGGAGRRTSLQRLQRRTVDVGRSQRPAPALFRLQTTGELI